VKGSSFCAKSYSSLNSQEYDAHYQQGQGKQKAYPPAYAQGAALYVK
jgi:hypothetical protein